MKEVMLWSKPAREWSYDALTTASKGTYLCKQPKKNGMPVCRGISYSDHKKSKLRRKIKSMKKIIKKFWGVGLVLMLLSTLFIMAAPVSAADPLMWNYNLIPPAVELGAWPRALTSRTLPSQPMAWSCTLQPTLPILRKLIVLAVLTYCRRPLARRWDGQTSRQGCLSTE